MNIRCEQIIETQKLQSIEVYPINLLTFVVAVTTFATTRAASGANNFMMNMMCSSVLYLDAAVDSTDTETTM